MQLPATRPDGWSTGTDRLLKVTRSKCGRGGATIRLAPDGGLWADRFLGGSTYPLLR
ncbi:hypothetical protein EMIT0357P_60410 [Pseudomonas marginalis]